MSKQRVTRTSDKKLSEELIEIDRQMSDLTTRRMVVRSEQLRRDAGGKRLRGCHLVPPIPVSQ